MALREIVKYALAIAFIAWCFSGVSNHLGYLSRTPKPSRDFISKELQYVVDAFPWKQASAADFLEKSNVLVTTGVRLSGPPDLFAAPESQKRMETLGWRKVDTSNVGVDRYCKGHLVAEIDRLESKGAYDLRIDWGNADSYCQVK